ncbi:cyclase dehydrase [Azospirillum thermophilum]|uniref:Cyclase dehydrase n=1 Tax=Azospirillum thermophilum TaxID=2202148 RepID=A0A2S2CMN3_9PROT|nr:cyclase dehydrase [Azospirillum thermophilum]AWK85741.1 cyclase dehydrase [Azospirillum thermophilum]
MAYYHRGSPADGLARGLGWFSLALGATEILAGRSLARWMGMEDRTALIRAYGAREVMAGLGLVALGDPKPWLWSRVAGDALDLATLATGWTDDNPRRHNVGLAIGAVAAVTALDLLCVGEMHRQDQAAAALPPPDYSDRSGLPRPPDEMRGTARDAPVGADMRTPRILQFQPGR